MATFPQIQLPDWTRPNPLWQDALTAQQIQNAKVVGATAQQDLADRASLRDLYPGLASADPLAMAQASTLGTQGTAAVTSVDATQQARMRQQMYGAGIGTQVASSIAAMPDDDSAAAAYPILRQRAIDQGMPATMLPEEFPGRAGMLAIRNTAVPVGTAVELYAKRPYVDGQDPGPLGIPGVGGTGGYGSAVGGAPHPASGQQVPAGQSLFTGAMPVSADQATQQAVGQAAQALGINPEWGMRVQHAETGNEPNAANAVSSAGAIGAMQLMPGTAAGLTNPDGTLINPHDPMQNINGGLQYLGQLKQRYGSPVIATAAYNAGPGRVDDWLAGKKPLPNETINYVGRVFGADGVGMLNSALSGAHGHAIPGYAGQSSQPQVPAQPVQVASAANTAGMPLVANDASAPTLPYSTVPATPEQLNATLGRLRSGISAPNTLLPLATGQGGGPSAPQTLNSLLLPPAASQGSSTPAPPTYGPIYPGSNVLSRRPPADTRFPVAPQGSRPGTVDMAQQPVPDTASEAQMMPVGTNAPQPLPGQNSLLSLVPQRAGVPAPSNSLVPSSAPAPAPAPAQAARLRLVDGKPIPVEGQPGFVQGVDASGRIVAMPLPGAVNTGRLAQRPNPNGGVDMIAPSGQVIAPAIPNSRDVQLADYQRDAKEIDGIADAGQAAQTTQVRLQQMRELVDKLNTGSGGTSRAQLAALAQTYLPEQAAAWASKTAGMSDPAAAQELAKLGLRGAGDQERGVLGARGGYQATKLFQAMNPGLDLLPNANRAILNSQLIGAQADSDYAAGALQHFNQNGAAFRNAQGAYVPLTNFDQQWQSQRNPQVYAAAMGAIAGLPANDGQVNGQPVRGWATGLSDAEYRRALDIVSRADPSAQVKALSGNTLSMQPANARGVAQQRAAPAAPQVGSVVQGYRFTGGDPASPSSWQALQ